VPIVNYESREITCKIVYYGPGRSGKTTNLQHVYSQLPDDRKGKMVSLTTDTDRTLFFDFLPLDLGSISGFATRFQLYTVPGQVYYQATRRLVLQGVDGVVFVADSQRRVLPENIESFQDLHANLAELGIEPRSVPMVMQYNKRDLNQVVLTPIVELERLLNFRDVPSFSASAVGGVGVFETLRAIASRVLSKLSAPAAPRPAAMVAR
jgi:mutual gliding-motility protein MglA